MGGGEAGSPAKAEDARWMRMALHIGRRMRGRTWPNPHVGCVIVSASGHVIGRGWTGAGGRPHAESLALKQAQALASRDVLKSATVYVTLEPCAHHGKTPPCADALIASGVRRVVYALEDPDPRVRGKGAGRMRAAGIAVCQGVLAAQARCEHSGFLSRILAKRPFLALKLATSMDGKIATKEGQSQWISGVPARRYVQGLRGIYDAVMVGGQTARADDPRLTLRMRTMQKAQPIAIIVSARLALPENGNLAARGGDLVIIHGPDSPEKHALAWRRRGAKLIEIGYDKDAGNPRLDMHALLQALGEEGLTRVLCEGGGRLAASLLKADLVDRLIHIGTGKILGGDGLAAIAPLGVAMVDAAPNFTHLASHICGNDTITLWQRRATTPPDSSI